MSDTSLLSEPTSAALDPASPPPAAFDQLRELVRNGYRPDPGHEAGGAILLRHDSAPALLLHRTGRIDVVARPPARALREPPAERRRMSKRRTVAIVILAAFIWFLSAYFTALILEGL